MGIEFQSLAPAMWKVFLPEEVLDRKCLGSADYFLFWSVALQLLRAVLVVYNLKNKNKSEESSPTVQC